MSESKIYISVINDLVTDQRVQRVAGTLAKYGFKPVLIGRRFPTSPELKLKNIEYKRFKLLINKGPLFYASYNIRLFFYLLSRPKITLLVANDLDTLLATWLVARIRGKKIVYDSHEYFTEVPELIDRNFVKKFWAKLERFLVPRVDYAYTVNDSLAKLYSAKYGIEFGVVRNIPDKIRKPINFEIPDHLKNKKLIVYQGAVNRDRGLEEIINTLPLLKESALIIAGDGDLLHKLKLLVQEKNLEDLVYFTGRLCPSKLKSLTAKADLGISLERKTNLNYYYALPNKIFDYVQAGVPIVCSAFPEMKRIIDDYKVGTTVDASDKELLTETIQSCLFDEEKRKVWIENCRLATDSLNWKNEQKKLIKLYTKAGLEFKKEKLKN